MIKVRDVAYVRFGAPDLDAMQKFTDDFGLITAARTEQRLYCRGTDPEPYVHITERGDPTFRGVAFAAASADDLQAAAELDGASSVEPIDAPGGGARVRFTDPDGFSVEVVHGRTPGEPLPVRQAAPLNTGSERRRFGVLQRVAAGPSSVKRLGHVVLRVSDFRRSAAWYESRFGFLRSDNVYMGDPQNVVTAFMRCDRGDVPVDHHTLLCVGFGEPGFDHAAFEVEDFDSLMVGHVHLRGAGARHQAGVGRHILGGQIYDYWCDPWGRMVEHFTDGDLLDAKAEPGLHDPGAALQSQWSISGS